MKTIIQNSKFKIHNRLLLALLLPVAAVGAVAVAQEKTPAQPAKTVTAGQKYKNIKVLKNLPADQLITRMREYNLALNVQCDFCHVVNAQRNAWDKDENPMKGVARQMITLVNDLNTHQKSLNGQATCYMCHHGHPEPITSVPASQSKEK